MVINDYLSASLLGVFMYPFLKFIIDHELYYLYVGLILVIVDLSTAVIKKLTRNLGSAFERPMGAVKCDILCREGLVEGNPGFPSGHATVAALFCTMIYLHTRDSRLLIFGIVYTGLICYSRVAKKCHTIVQVTAGVLYGVLMGILSGKFAS